jgi:6-phosphogluconate dehydrogenase (decarboxylating)
MRGFLARQVAPCRTREQFAGPPVMSDGSNSHGKTMARKYSKAASKKVGKALDERKKGTLKSGPSGKGGTVKSRKQAIAIGLSQARAEGKKVPKKPAKKAKKKKS